MSVVSHSIHGRVAKHATLVNSFKRSEALPIEPIPLLGQLWQAYETTYHRLTIPMHEAAKIFTSKMDAPDQFSAFHEVAEDIARNSPTSHEFNILAGMLFKRMSHVMDNPEVIESFLETSIGKQSPRKKHNGATVALITLECERRFPNTIDLLGLIGKMGWAFEDVYGTGSSLPLENLVKSFGVIHEQKELLAETNHNYTQSEIEGMRQFILDTLGSTTGTITALSETLRQLHESGMSSDDINLRAQQSTEIIEDIKRSSKKALGLYLRQSPPEIQAFLKPHKTPTPLMDILKAIESNTQPDTEAGQDLEMKIEETRSKFNLSAKQLRRAVSYQSVSNTLRNGIIEQKRKLLPKIDSAHAMEISKFLIRLEQRLSVEEATAVFDELDKEALREIELLEQQHISKNSHSAVNQPVLQARRAWLAEHADILTSNHFPASIQIIGRHFLHYQQEKTNRTNEADS